MTKDLIALAATVPHLPETFYIGFVLSVLAVAIVFYARSWVPMDLVSLGLLVVLVVFFQLFPLTEPETGKNLLDAPRLLQGFSHPALITVICLLIVGEGVTRTGALKSAAPLIKKLSFGDWRLALAISLVMVAGASAFLNNAPVVVIFIPILAALAEDLGVSVSKLLMPLSFASILGGTCTLIGTSTNILVASYAGEAGGAGFDMFSFSSLGLIVLAVGLVYLIFFAPRLLPDRDPAVDSTGSRPFVAQMEILSGSTLAGWSLGHEGVDDLFAKTALQQVIRNGAVFPPGQKDLVLRPGDILILVGTARDLKALEWNTKSTLVPTLGSSRGDSKGGNGRADATESDQRQLLAEVAVPPESPMVGRILSRIRFRQQYGPAVIGIQYHRYRKMGRITEMPLRAGDLILIQGFPRQIDMLSERKEMLLFWGVQDTLVQTAKAPAAAAILAAVVLLAATHLADMLVLAVVGAFAMLATRCLSLRHAFSAISSQVVLVVAATLALGEAMQATGAAALLARSLIHFTFDTPPEGILALFVFLVMLLTNVISNNASAILLTPIAISVAGSLGVSAMPFLMAVVFGANAAFSTPIGYKTNLLVMGAGCYSFQDFLRVGLPLNGLVWLVVSILIPVFWPF